MSDMVERWQLESCERELTRLRAELDRVRIELGTTTIASNAAHKGWAKAIDELQQARDRLRLAERIIPAWQDYHGNCSDPDVALKRLTEMMREWRASE